MLRLRSMSLLAALLLCAACGGQPAAQSPPPIPSPTIAAAAAPAPAQPTPTPANLAAQAPTAPAVPAPDLPAANPAPAGDPALYVWPADLPADLTVSPAESRIAADGEVGPNGLGFYIVTLNAGAKKLVIGGGDLGEALPLTGAERPVTLGQRTGKLITKDQQRELLFDGGPGKLFVYGMGFGEDELLRVAGSLQPIELQALRKLVAAK